jgi:hypothetical protein
MFKIFWVSLYVALAILLERKNQHMKVTTERMRAIIAPPLLNEKSAQVVF